MFYYQTSLLCNKLRLTQEVSTGYIIEVMCFPAHSYIFLACRQLFERYKIGHLQLSVIEDVLSGKSISGHIDRPVVITISASTFIPVPHWYQLHDRTFLFWEHRYRMRRCKITEKNHSALTTSSHHSVHNNKIESKATRSYMSMLKHR